MTTQGVSDKKERSLAELIIVIVLITVLMKVFISAFFSQEKQIKDVGFYAISSNFSAQLTAIHAQWIIDGHPQRVQLSLLNDKEAQAISVNKFGWVDVEKNTLACEQIWQQVMTMPLLFMKTAISAIEIKKGNSKQGRICRFSIASGQYFEYSSVNGNVLNGKNVKSN